jgi:hypothetical protein
MKPSNPQNPVDLYFMDARSKLIDIAAFMDRVEREGATGDFRYQAFREALDKLGEDERAISVLRSLSDPTEELIPEATTKAACGDWPRNA